MTKKKSTKKPVPKRKVNKKPIDQQQEVLKARLEQEVSELVKKPAQPTAAEASLSLDKQKIRRELLAEIAAAEHPETVEYTKPDKEPEPTLPGKEEKATPVDPIIEQPSLVAVEKVELKTRLKLRRFHKKLWLWLPLVALLFYSGFYILRLDKIYSGVVSYLPWPAAIVNGKIIWLDELVRETNLVKKFEITVQPEDLALNHLIEEQIIQSYFRRYSLELPPQSLNQQLNTLAAEFGSEEALADYLNINYSLTPEEFTKYILSPYLRRLTLQEYLSHSPKESTEAEGRAWQIKQSIENNEISFEEAAGRYSDDAVSAQDNGSLGWFTWGAMIPEFEAALRNLAVGEISAPVRSAYGYHLLRLDEVEGPRPTNHEDSSPGSVKASHIFVLVLNFDAWLEAQKKTASKVLLIPLQD